MNVEQLIIFLVAIILAGALATFSALVVINYLNTKKKLKQMTIDAAIISFEFQQLLAERDAKPLEETQGFIKFISESRDWAFTYIEDVQNAIKEYQKIADVVPISKDMTIDQAEKLSQSYDKLINFLPTEEVNN